MSNNARKGVCFCRCSGTVTLKLDKATHIEGLEFKHDYHLLTRGEVEMIFLGEKNNRFVEL